MHEAVELWGGPECTINRVGDGFSDQFARSGHDRRLDDIDRFADLGLRTLRYPLLWERIAPARPDACDWRWADAAMAALARRGVRVIAGLVHHGSGPRYTSLLDDAGFAAGLARHARAVAERYPEIGDWTPVNEPLTTARFSALYGHWYPHARAEPEFWRALLNQIDGVRLAMRAVRAINPRARLIQTDDLGRTYATAALRDQAAFDNLRRWASWDLLTGRVTKDHPLWARLARYGLASRLAAIADDPCPPDLIGINHYLTSDRFLDHRLHRYPARSHGGSDTHRYADVEAIRVLEPAPPGLAGALGEAWARYGIPLAITEAHNGCTREEQLRWLVEAWDSAVRLRGAGVDVRAVTVWSLLGSHGWNTLLTSPGLYEPGVFDLSGGTPRPTALAGLVRALAEGAAPPPLAGGAGWWRRPLRLEHPPVPRPAPLAEHRPPAPRPAPPPMLLLGGDSAIGRAIRTACAVRGLAVTAIATADLDAALAASPSPLALIDASPAAAGVGAAEGLAPAALVACAAAAADRLARAAARGVPSLSFTTDLVFAPVADAAEACDEQARPRPATRYGALHAEIDRRVARLAGQHLRIRHGPLLDPAAPPAWLGALRDGAAVALSDSGLVSPAHLPDLVRTALDLLEDDAGGSWHLCHAPALSWAGLGRRLARATGADPALVRATAAPAPAGAPLASRRGAPLPPLDDALAAFAAALAPAPAARRAA
ncbi:sugar nucleotide-binding protein [Sphingomonas morindae]|uniref:Sugar nucleotide-binding protein n=1 Tax=Sphingomonas morindae TaxID=1541170 RepID=A0ABY4XDJ8_9SPHN|nr:sugar nucleotide-binding protein [Sphingomonas morindae]USI74998.1 sugar nucleotide-binding protein [Sphingomonas morindae]